MIRQILHIDDDPDVLKAIAKQLRRAGFEVVSQTVPATALHLINTGAVVPDVVISDGAMPGMTGREIYDRLPHPLQHRFVAFSGSCELFDGCPCPVVTKPDHDELLRVVRQMVDGERSDAA